MIKNNLTRVFGHISALQAPTEKTNADFSDVLNFSYKIVQDIAEAVNCLQIQSQIHIHI